MPERPVIALAGGSGAGKSTLLHALFKRMPGCFALVSQDRYYRDLGALPLKQRRQTNFDHPDALEEPLIASQLTALKTGEPVKAPVYDFASHSRAGYETIMPADMMLFEGTVIYALPSIQPLIDVRVFLDVPDDVRRKRRIRRDVAERGRTEAFSAEQWARTVKPMHDQFIDPYKQNADLILNGEAPVDELVDELIKVIESRYGNCEERAMA